MQNDDIYHLHTVREPALERNTTGSVKSAILVLFSRHKWLPDGYNDDVTFKNFAGTPVHFFFELAEHNCSKMSKWNVADKNRDHNFNNIKNIWQNYLQQLFPPPVSWAR